ncbi:nucleoside-diphosphate sugar epimerase/dehydratase [Marinobacter arenosus]|uniref:nucleoside-diphosphate sugar epimerase/dehydratase n=1 Tax=Marinobacter arenosus TaxID=2856822 RepID=UPI001C4D97D0|nr:nucleoside-diphosphate sugar epimerase/dehydratase [Marinobacter arenosus]MBW0146830.1 polysaccharide biosynthesis protein [Marinobacter arenosus]
MFEYFLNLSRPRKRVISVGVDVCGLSVSLWVAFVLRLDNLLWSPDQRQVAVFAATIALTIFGFIRLGLYRAIVRYMSDKAFLTILYGIGISAASLIVLGHWFEIFLPRSVPLIYALLSFSFVAGSRMWVRVMLNRPSYRNKERVAIVGAGPTGVQLANALSTGIEYQPVVFITLDSSKHKALIHGVPVVGLDHMEFAIRKHRVRKLLLALEPATKVNRKQLIGRLETLGVPVQRTPGVQELISGQARINDIRDLELADLLGRDPVEPDNAMVAASLYQKSVMVTGAGGSIGSELCRQIIRHKPKCLVLFEQTEFSLYRIERELASINQINGLGVELHAVLGSVVHRRRCETVMRSFGVSTVYHAAAYKHVPLVEHNVIEGVQNNVFGTAHAAEAAISAGVERFVLISTDKAVRPTNVMGASKRMAELVLQGLAARQSSTVFSMVRFGNVLGSSGSVVPLFRDQIRDGGPVTVTHPDIIRYFMTIPEASQLVLQAGSMGRGGEVFVLDMGEPVKIADLARKMIHLMGLTEKSEEVPDGDIEIVFTGLRPGEKLYEELLIGDNPQGTQHPRIMMAREVSMSPEDLKVTLNGLLGASQEFDCSRVVEILCSAPTGFAPTGEVADLVWCNKEKVPAVVSSEITNIRRFPS